MAHAEIASGTATCHPHSARLPSSCFKARTLETERSYQGPPTISEQSIRTHFEFFQTELDALKDEIRNIYEKNQLQCLADSGADMVWLVGEAAKSCCFGVYKQLVTVAAPSRRQILLVGVGGHVTLVWSDPRTPIFARRRLLASYNKLVLDTLAATSHFQSVCLEFFPMVAI